MRQARGGAVTRRHAVAVTLPEGDLNSKKSGGSGGGGLLASYLRALDSKPITTKVRVRSEDLLEYGGAMEQDFQIWSRFFPQAALLL